MTTERPSDRDRTTIAHLKDRIAAQAETIIELKKEHEQMVKSLDEMSTKLDKLYGALMEPQAGQDKSLLDRVGRIAVAYESGGVISGIVVKVAGLIIAIGIVIAALRASVSSPP